MSKRIIFSSILLCLGFVCVMAQGSDATGLDLTDAAQIADLENEGSEGIQNILKVKFIEGNALFMSLVSLALILGLAFCVERIIFLSLSDIDTRKFLDGFKTKLSDEGQKAAGEYCDSHVGPVACIARQALEYQGEDAADIERSITSFAEVQVGKLEKGCSWITLFIAIAPSLGFLGTVIGMVMAFDQIQTAGDISPTIVASGMKVALITTIFGIVVAVILQLFYNYILSRIEHLTSEMEQASIEIVDVLRKK